MNQEIRYFLIIFIFFGITSVVLQGMFVPYLELQSAWRPDLVVVIVLLIGRRFGATLGSTTGFILGIMQDALSPMSIGLTALPKAFCGYAAGKMQPLKLEGSINLLWFITFIFVHEFVVFFILQFKLDVSFTYLLYSRVFPNTIYTSVMLTITYFSTQKYFMREE